MMKRWQMMAASVTGASHWRGQVACQDAHQVYRLENGGVVVAVADGLGSAVCADQGAQLAVTEAIIALQEGLSATLPQDEAAWSTVLGQAFARARLAIETLAAAEERPLRDYATTLIVVVVTDGWIGLGQVGDGAVVALPEQGEMQTLSIPQRGEFANETMPLTHPDALAAVRYLCRSDQVQALAIFTDGLQNLCLEAGSYTPYHPFFVPLFTQICAPLDPTEAEAALVDFLQSERVTKRSDDDKTLVLIGRTA